MTGKQMCEYIAETWNLNGITVTPEDVWTISPGGELYPVVQLYWQARAINGDEITYSPDGTVYANGRLLADSPEPAPRKVIV